MAQGNTKVDGGRYLAEMYSRDPLQAALFQKIIDGVNGTAAAAGVAPFGHLDPPPPVNSIDVKTSGEFIHAVANHFGAVARPIQYIWQYDTDPNFPRPHYAGTSGGRTLNFQLPTKDDNGATVNYYLRVIPQYVGSLPGDPTAYGGSVATAINLAGTTQLTLLPSTGGGTTDNTGQQGNHGIGTVQTRPAARPNIIANRGRVELE